MKGKIDVIKLLSIIGTLLSVGGTIISGIAGEKKVKATIAELVKEELKNK